MIQRVIGLEMSLAKHATLMIDLFLLNNKIAVFLEQKKSIINPLLKNVGYNNSTQNQNVFKPIARDFLRISSVNIEFSNESIP